MSDVLSDLKLDRKDFTLLTALQRDASQRLEDLARVVDLAPSSVHERLQRLQRSGVLKRWTVDLDASSLGLPVMAFIGVRAAKPCSEYVAAVQKIRGVIEAHSVAGGLSMLLKVRAASTDQLLEITERLRQIPGIEQTETTIVLRTHFEAPLPLEPKPRDAC